MNIQFILDLFIPSRTSEYSNIYHSVSWTNLYGKANSKGYVFSSASKLLFFNIKAQRLHKDTARCHYIC